MKSPTLNGLNIINKTPAAKFAKDPCNAKPTANPARGYVPSGGPEMPSLNQEKFTKTQAGSETYAAWFGHKPGELNKKEDKK